MTNIIRDLIPTINIYLNITNELYEVYQYLQSNNNINIFNSRPYTTRYISDYNLVKIVNETDDILEIEVTKYSGTNGSVENIEIPKFIFTDNKFNLGDNIRNYIKNKYIKDIEKYKNICYSNIKSQIEYIDIANKLIEDIG